MISCAYISNNTDPAFNVRYCPEQFLEHDKELIKKRIFAYEFIHWGDRKRELKQLDDKIAEAKFHNKFFLEKPENIILFQTIVKKMFDFTFGTDTYKEISSLAESAPNIPIRKHSKANIINQQIIPITTNEIKNNNLVNIIYAENNYMSANNDFNLVNKITKNELSKVSELNEKNDKNNKNEIPKITNQSEKENSWTKQDNILIEGTVYNKNLRTSKNGNDYFTFSLLEKETKQFKHLVVFSTFESKVIFAEFQKINDDDFVKLKYKQKNIYGSSYLIVEKILEIIPTNNNPEKLNKN